MGQSTEAFVGIDAAKARNAIAVAEGGRGGEVRYLGEVDASRAGHAPDQRWRPNTTGCTSATKRAPPAMGCTGSSPLSGTRARSSRHR